MLQSERLERIDAYVKRKKFASFHELMEMYKVSKATIRRDLEKLSAENRLILVRGGAVSSQESLLKELPYDEKRTGNRAEKIRIAEAASKLIAPNNTVIIDSGTTIRELTPYLSNLRDIHIITNDIALAGDLTKVQNLEISVIGGKLRNGYYNLMGYYAEKMIQEFYADIALVSMDSVSILYGCMLTNIDEVASKKAIVASAEKSILLCDHSKFEKTALVSAFPLKSIDIFITGKELDSSIANTMREMGHELILV